MKRASYVYAKAHCIRETSQAVLVTCEAWGPREVWIPKSQLHEDSEVYGLADEGKLIVFQWWVNKNRQPVGEDYEEK